MEGKNYGNFVQKGEEGRGASLTSSEDVLSTSRGGAGRTGGEWCCGDVGGDACSCRGDPGDVGLQHNDVIHNVIRRTSCGAWMTRRANIPCRREAAIVIVGGLLEIADEW